VNKCKFVFFFIIFHFVSFTIAISNAVLSTRFKTVIHTRCTNEQLSTNTITEIVTELRRNVFVFIIFKILIIMIGIVSLTTIVYSYVVICRIIRRKRVTTRVKLTNVIPLVKKNVVNRYSSNNSTLFDHHNSLIFQRTSKDEFPALANSTSSNNCNSISLLTGINKENEQPSSLYPKASKRRWSVDINAFSVNSNGGILKKSNLPMRINRRNSSFSNANRLNSINSSSITSYVTGYNNNDDVQPESELTLVENLSSKAEPVISFQTDCRRQSIKFNEIEKKPNSKIKQLQEYNQSSNEYDNDEKQNDLDRSSIFDRGSYTFRHKYPLWTSLFNCKKLFYSVNSQVSFKQSSILSTNPNSSNSGNNDSSTTVTIFSSNGKINKSQIQSAALRKTFIIILVFFIFWLPFLIVQSIILIHDNQSFLLEHLNLMSIAIGFCHSSINPLVYCCTNIEILNAMKTKFKLILPSNSIIKSINRIKSRDNVSITVNN
jgi:hypothetical protein